MAITIKKTFKHGHGGYVNHGCRCAECLAGVKLYNSKSSSKANHMRTFLKRAYNLTVREYSEMLEKQNGVCAICCKKEADGSRLCVDHDHASGKIRGLLCKDCNVGIARFHETLTTILSAASYMCKHGVR